MAVMKTKIKEYRAKFNMRQDELAELVDARRETIIRIEKGQYNPSLKLAMDIAKVFGVTVEEIFSFEDGVEE
ncbi:MAG: helix-turn-helix transcriptional regulator [Agathobacter sp.]|nr:helix-turn-helix transcriptional regulator [Agathobacter sp.]